MCKLPARQDVKRDACTPKTANELFQTSGDLSGIDDVLRVHMRCRDDRPSPVRNRCRREREAVIDRSRPVIDPGKQMEVELDVAQTTRMIHPARPDSVMIS